MGLRQRPRVRLSIIGVRTDAEVINQLLTLPSVKQVDGIPKQALDYITHIK